MTSSDHDDLPGLPYANDHLTIRQVPGEAIVVLERNEVPFPQSEEALDAVFAHFVGVLRALPQAELHFVIDSRRSPGRNDAAFETVQARYRADLFTAFRSTSAIMASVVGRMQVSRYERDAASPGFQLFESVEQAVEALRSR